MSLKLPLAPGAYDKGDQAQMRGAIERADLQNRKRQEDLVLGPGQRLVFYDEHGGEQHFTGAVLGGLVRSDMAAQGLSGSEQANARANIAAGAGGGTPGGASGQLQFNSAGAFGGLTVGGDGTLNTGTGVLTVTKTGGVAFGDFATGTDAANLTGTVSVNRFNSGSGASSSTFLRGDGTWAAPGGGSGTVTHTVGGLTSGQLVVGNGSADIKVSDLTGDLTTSGSTATTIAANAVTTSKINAAAVTEAKIGLSNVTTNNVSTSAHGFAPILPNDATKYLDGTGAYSAPGVSPGGATYSVPAIGSMTWVNQGSTTASQAVSGGSVIMNIAPVNTGAWKGLFQNIPAAPCKVKAQLRMFSGAVNSQIVGLYFYNGTKLSGIETLSQVSSQITVRVINLTSVTDTSSPNLLTLGPELPNPFSAKVGMAWHQLRDDGTTLYYDVSLDGINFYNIYSQARTTFLTPTQIGFGGANITTSTSDVLWALNFVVVGNANLN